MFNICLIANWYWLIFDLNFLCFSFNCNLQEKIWKKKNHDIFIIFHQSKTIPPLKRCWEMTIWYFKKIESDYVQEYPSSPSWQPPSEPDRVTYSLTNFSCSQKKLYEQSLLFFIYIIMICTDKESKNTSVLQILSYHFLIFFKWII